NNDAARAVFFPEEYLGDGHAGATSDSPLQMVAAVALVVLRHAALFATLEGDRHESDAPR
ncbi:MAG TPA: hypothetical protein VFJ10_15940, partial [Acidobacteriaceae bacterium]|nr:hypothetical protein [Acidobacteriaceae bacterium]